jgi:hypothetical protein
MLPMRSANRISPRMHIAIENNTSQGYVLVTNPWPRVLLNRRKLNIASIMNHKYRILK